MHILVIGASGYLGRHMVTEFLDRGHEVTVCSRSEALIRRLFPECRYERCDFLRDEKVEDWLPRLKDVDVVVNAVGIIKERGEQTFERLHYKTPVALFKACEQAGVKRVIQVSALGAEEDSTTEYHKTKHAADEALRALNVPSVIIKPALIYGVGGASWNFFRSISALPVVPIIGDGKTPVQPIHIDDVVYAITSAINIPLKGSKTVDLVGSQELTFETYLEAMRKWMGLGKMRKVYVPFSVARFIAPVSLLLDNVPLSRDVITMLEQSKVYDPQKCADSLGVRPTGFEERLTHMVATPARRMYSRIYFLQYLLSLSLAFLWIWTAYVSAFVHPVESSYALLGKLGISQAMAPFALYGACVLDFLIGLAMLFRYRLYQVCWLQIGLIGFYTIVLSVVAPEMWSDPFGPLSKNVPIVFTILLVMGMQEKRYV